MSSYRKGSKNCKPKTKITNRVFHEFRGNQHTSEFSTEFTSSSARKLSLNGEFDVKCDDSFNYCILSFSLVFSALSSILKCKTCDKDVKFTKTGIRGMGFNINIECDCGDRKINSSPYINTGFEINRRIVFVMRLLGVGRSGLELFSALMDITSHWSRNAYYKIFENVQIAAKSVADICLRKAGREEKEKNVENGLPEDELVVSGDGTWLKRGFSSAIGVCSVIGKYTGKVLDTFVSCKVCKSCQLKEKELNSADFEIWYESEHQEQCSANYNGSSGGMEVQGIIEIFKNSHTLHKAKYAYYIGDGDSKTFTNLCNAKPYGDFVIQKLECVLHVGKRMYRHLKEVKKSLTELKKFKKAEEKKKEEQMKKETAEEEDTKSKVKQPRKKRKTSDSVSSPPKTTDLTEKVMKEMSTNYSLAIQRYPDSREEMKREIWAGFFHRISTDDEPQHGYCNPDWCKYLKAQADNVPFKHKPALSAEVQQYVKPVFEKLTNDDLLKRCLGKNTQNNNECYNKTLWAIVPKHTFVGKEVVELGVQVSLAIFNEGRMTLLKMMEVMGCTIGRSAYQYVMDKDEERIYNADKASMAASKEGRLAKKEVHQREEDAFNESGLLLYGPGIAD